MITTVRLSPIILLMILMSCLTNNGHAQETLKPIDIGGFVRTIFRFSNGNEHKTVTSGDSVISFDHYLPSEILFFKIENLKSGITEFIRGAKKFGYEYEVKKRGDSLAEKRQYFGNGKLKSIEKEIVKEDFENPVLKFPLGFKKNYNESGLLINTINYNKLYKFRYNDVLKYLRKHDKSGIRVTSILAFDNGKDDAVWHVNYVSNEKGFSFLSIDAGNGKIRHEDHAIARPE